MTTVKSVGSGGARVEGRGLSPPPTQSFFFCFCKIIYNHNQRPYFCLSFFFWGGGLIKIFGQSSPRPSLYCKVILIVLSLNEVRQSTHKPPDLRYAYKHNILGQKVCQSVFKNNSNILSGEIWTCSIIPSSQIIFPSPIFFLEIYGRLVWYIELIEVDGLQINA